MAQLREYKGAAVATRTNGGIGAVSETIEIENPSGWPTGLVGPFTIVIDPGLSTEEKIQIASRSGGVLTVAQGGRGFDGTLGTEHGDGAVVRHVATADDLSLMNSHAARQDHDDHSQYQHISIARTVTASHTYTGDPDFQGDPTFSGTPEFSGDPIFGGNPVFTGTPDFADFGAYLASLDDLADLRDALIEAGTYRLIGFEGATPGWLDTDGTSFDPALYPALAVKFPDHKVPLIEDTMLSAAGTTRLLGTQNGADTFTLGPNNVPAHKHPITDKEHNHTGTGGNHVHPLPGGYQHVISSSVPENHYVQAKAGLAPTGGHVNVTFTDPPSASGSVTNVKAFTGITTTENQATTTEAVTIVNKNFPMRVQIKAH